MPLMLGVDMPFSPMTTNDITSEIAREALIKPEELEQIKRLDKEASDLWRKLQMEEWEWKKKHQPQKKDKFRWRDITIWKILDFIMEMIEMDEEPIEDGPKMEDDPKIRAINRKRSDIALERQLILGRIYDRQQKHIAATKYEHISLLGIL